MHSYGRAGRLRTIPGRRKEGSVAYLAGTPWRREPRSHDGSGRCKGKGGLGERATCKGGRRMKTEMTWELAGEIASSFGILKFFPATKDDRAEVIKLLMRFCAWSEE